MSIGGWEAQVDSMIDGSAADAAARGKGGRGRSQGGSGDDLFQGLMGLLGIGNKPLAPTAPPANAGATGSPDSPGTAGISTSNVLDPHGPAVAQQQGMAHAQGSAGLFSHIFKVLGQAF